MNDLINQLVQATILTSDLKIKGGKGFGSSRLDNMLELKRCVDIHTSFLPSETSNQIRLYCISHNITILPTCNNCGCSVIHKLNTTTGFPTFCSSKCAQTSDTVKSNISTSLITKYGQHHRKLETTKEKQRLTNIKKYGVSEVLSSQLIREKGRGTCQSLYGADYHSQSEQGRAQRIATNLANIGVEFPTQSKVVQDKIKNTILTRYNVTSTSKLDWVKDKQLLHIKNRYVSIDAFDLLNNKDWLADQHHTQHKSLTEIAYLLGLKDEKSISAKLNRFNIDIKIYHNIRSLGEQQVCGFLNDLAVDYNSNNRTIIQPKELDIYIPKYKLAIEYCGLYWHSDKHKIPLYHQHKLDQCNKMGIRLITIFEDEWNYRPNIVKQKIKNIIGIDNNNKIFARKCSVSSVSTPVKIKFFDCTHIQGSGPGSINIGLYYNDELVSCMSFIKQKGGVFVLNRYATSCRVVGGFSKLLSHFKKTREWTEIVSFADLRWSQGDVYEKNGFVLDKILPPDYAYIINNKRVHKFNFRHKSLSTKLKQYDPLLTERENCDNNGILRIWDCGKLRYVCKNR